MAEGTLVPTPAALVRRWCEGTASGKGLSGTQRPVMTFMELDAAAGGRGSSTFKDELYPPAMLGPASNTGWDAVVRDASRFEALVTDTYGGSIEQTGTNWIRLRWREAEAA